MEKIKEFVIKYLKMLGNSLGEKKFKKLLLGIFLIILFYISTFLGQKVIEDKIPLISGAIIAVVVFLYVIKRMEALFYLLIFSLPFIEFPFIIKFDAFNFANSMYVFFLFIYLFRGVINNKILIPRTYLDWPIGLTILIFFVSIIQSRYITGPVYAIKGSFMNAPYFRTMFQLTLFIVIVSSFYVTVSFLKDKEKIKNTIKVWIYSSAFVALLGLYGYFFASHGMPFAAKFLVVYTTRIRSVFKEPVFYGLYFATVIPLLYSLILNKCDILPRRQLYLFFALNLAAMFLTMSRASWIATMVVVIFISSINLRFKSRRVKIATILIVIIIVSSIAVGLFFISQSVAQKTTETRIGDIFTGKDFSVLARIDAMATAWAIFKSHPILGAGLGNYYYMYSKYSPFSKLIYTWGKEVGAMFLFPDANNMYLTVLSETGIIGFCAVLSIFIVLIINIIRSLRQSMNKYWDPFLKGYLGGIIFIMIVYLFTSTLTYAFLWVMLGIIVAIQRQTEVSKSMTNDKNQNPNESLNDK